MRKQCQSLTNKGVQCKRFTKIGYMCKQHCAQFQYGGGDYLYHGTSLAYINYIQKYGLTGRYPDDLYKILLDNYQLIRYDDDFKPTPKIGYIQDFISRQTEVRQMGYINLSFTANLSVAREFANSARVNGEGPGEMIREIYKAYKREQYVNTSEGNITQLKNLFKIFGIDPYRKPYGIILAVKKEDIKQEYQIFFSHKPHLSKYHQDELDREDMYENTIHVAIKPELIHIFDENKYIKLVSPQGDQYISELINQGQVQSQIPSNMMDKTIQLSTEELVNYQVRADGCSDKYPSYLFTNVLYLGNDIWSLIIRDK